MLMLHHLKFIRDIWKVNIRVRVRDLRIMSKGMGIVRTGMSEKKSYLQFLFFFFVVYKPCCSSRTLTYSTV